MRILLIASRVPYPLHNGEDLRIFQLAKQLWSRHEIHLITYGDTGRLCPEIRDSFKQVYLLDEPIQAKTVRRTFRRIIIPFLPDQIYVFDTRIDALIRKLTDEQQFDWIWIPAWQMMPYAYGVSKTRVFLDVMDDGVLESIRETRRSKTIKQFVINVKRLLVTYMFEKKYFSRATICCLVTEADARFLRRVCSKANVVTIPNGVDCEYFRPLGLQEEYPSLVFEGNMGFGPSVDAICYFHSEIFPQIKKQIAGTKLWIVGKEPANEVQNLQAEDVTVTGYVEDVRPYLDRASVFVCPMRKGAGIKNKVLQAWAMGKPVVSTTIALAGLDAKPGDNVVVADTPHQFAAQVVRLLKDQSLRKTVGERGMQTVHKHYGWRQQAELLEATLEKN